MSGGSYSYAPADYSITGTKADALREVIAAARAMDFISEGIVQSSRQRRLRAAFAELDRVEPKPPTYEIRPALTSEGYAVMRDGRCVSLGPLWEAEAVARALNAEYAAGQTRASEFAAGAEQQVASARNPFAFTGGCS